MTKKILIFDFDGVIVNSINECLITSYNAFQQFENTGLSSVYNLSNIPRHHQQYFNTYRKFVRPAGEYYLLHLAYKENLAKIDGNSFKYLLTLHKNKIIRYQTEFFKERNRFRLRNNNEWLHLHSVYRHLADCWNALADNYNIFIVSNKDKVSIILLMDYFNLPVNEDQIFGAESGNNKKKIIENIIDKSEVSPENVYFIDDNLDNLISTKDLEIKLYLAMWGYGNLNENDDPSIKKIFSENILQKLL